MTCERCLGKKKIVVGPDQNDMKYRIDCPECAASPQAAPEAVSAEFAGYVEPVPENARGFGRYKYRVIGRSGFACHHTNSMKDAEWYLNECRKHWAKT